MKKFLAIGLVVGLLIGLSGCFLGPKAHSGITHRGYVSYVLDYTCIEKALKVFPEVVNINYTEKSFSQDQVSHIYKYRTRESNFPKSIGVTINDNTRSFIWHEVYVEYYSIGEREKEELNKNRPLMNAIEKEVVTKCNLPKSADFFEKK